MSEPDDIFQAWQQATDFLADTFADAADLTRGSRGSFFLDWIPPAENVAALWVSGGNDGIPWRGDNPPTEIRMNWKTEGRFETPERARLYASALMAAMPIRCESNIQLARPQDGAVPNIEGRYFRMVEGKPAVLLFVVEFGGEVVFNIGRSYD